MNPSCFFKNSHQLSTITSKNSTGTIKKKKIKTEKFIIYCSTSNNGTKKHSTTIHKLIEKHGVILGPGIYDALSAKIMSSMGHKTAFISGYAVSATLLGEPDLGLLTPPEMARRAGQICAAVPALPIIADADTGGGNVLNVRRTVKQFMRVGCKGCVIEDQEWPKRAGHMRGKEVISMEEHAAKIYAAREVIGDEDFFLIARTDARATSAKRGLDDAITRANLYMDAGADASYIEAPRSDYELQEIGQRTKGIRVCNMIEGGLTPMKSPKELKDFGFHIIAHPLSGLFAAAYSMKKAYLELFENGTTRDSMSEMIDFEEFNNLIGLEELLELEEKLTGSRKSREEKLRVKIKGDTKKI